MSTPSHSELQQRIDAVTWYHEFDFPNGLSARSKTPDVANHRRLWAHIRAQLDQIDFRGKTVLDLGCWDGYWSFYAEKRGAKRVLATDDVSQNWGKSAGLLLAKELLGSSIETRLDVSVYDLESLRERFDIILCLGIYYHLFDPLYAFAQVRHCCNRESVAVFEGDVMLSGAPRFFRYDLADLSIPYFLPPMETLDHMLEAVYFDVQSASLMLPANLSPLAFPSRWRLLKHVARFGAMPPNMAMEKFFTAGRRVTVCRPVEQENRLHHYRPPFRLDQYDPRFKHSRGGLAPESLQA